MQFLAISGSLRAASSNTALLEAARLVAPDGVEVILYQALGDLPHFNPDLDVDGVDPPLVVRDFRARVGRADGLLISSPEYAHGVPGVLKNGLDWLVGSLEFCDKPVALLSTSLRGVYVQASLTETLGTMTARLVAAASITVPLLGATLDAAAIAGDPGFAGALQEALGAFALAINTGGAK